MMFTCEDNGIGVVRTQWQDVALKVQSADPQFTVLVNKLSPGTDFPVYLIYLPYGMLKGDTESSYLPLSDGKYCKLSDDYLPKEIKDDLGYGKNSSPLGMILENQIEYFIEIEGETIPYDIAGPGRIFNKSIFLNKKSLRNYSSNALLSASAGCRTGFLLPSINSYSNIMKLSAGINVKISPPKKIADHWDVFKKIMSSEVIQSSWRVCLLYFSEKWVQALSHDPAWLELKAYISEVDLVLQQYDSNSIGYEIFYSYVQKNYNLKVTNPYITHTAIHLIKIALGVMPGYIPATAEQSLPLSVIQNTFCDFYDIDQLPTVMIPHKFMFETERFPIYYSLQYPTMPGFSIKKNTRISANNEIDALDYILPCFIDSMKDPNSLLRDTVFDHLAEKICFSYFHNAPYGNNKINHSDQLQNIDDRFIFNSEKLNKKFCHEGKFLRGCVKINAL